MIKKILLPYHTRKHTLCNYVLKSDENKEYWLDLTVLRKSKGFESVPVYEINEEKINLCGYRSVHILHKEGIY